MRFHFSLQSLRGFSLRNFFSLLTGSYRQKTTASAVFHEEQPHETGFATHYATHVKPHLVEFEANRMAALEEASRRTKLAIPSLPLAIIITFFLIKYSQEGDFISLPIGVFALLVFWVGAPLRSYSATVKSDIFPGIMSFLPDFSYSPHCEDRAHLLEDSGILPSYDREESEDEIRGEYKAVDIDLFETRLKEKRRTKNSTYYVDIFKGVFITFKAHKTFQGQTIVRKDSGALGNWVKDKFSDLENVELEDPRFEDIFEVYGTDQIEARYLLTTSFMERLMDLADAFGSKRIECAFYNDTLLLKIDLKRNLFEAGSVFEPEDFVDDAKQLLNDIQLICAIIDTLKLDQNIGL